MRLVIDATTARSRGALTDHVRILPEVDALLQHSEEATVLAAPELADALSGRLQAMRVETTRCAPGLRRSWGLQTEIRSRVRTLGADVAMFGVVAPFGMDIPYVLRMTEPAMADPAYERCYRHSTLPDQLQIRLKKRWFRAARRRAAGVIVSSAAIAHDIEAAHGDGCPTVVSPFGPPDFADQNVIHAGPRGSRIMTMHATPHKNIEVLLDALREPVLASHTLTLIADLGQLGSKYERSLARRAAANGVASRVRPLDFVTGRQGLLRELMAHDVLVVPSVTETWSHGVVEAMSIGMPVIASDIRCHAEVAQGGAALFPPDDAAALASRIADVYAKTDETAARCARGRSVVAGLSWSRHALTILETLRAAARTGPTPA